MKESDKFVSSNIFEGMTSIRSVLYAYQNSISTRRIVEILYSEKKSRARFKELNYLNKISSAFGFTMTRCTDEEINMLAIGNTHGGILAKCTDRHIPELFEVPLDAIEPNGFYMMLDGIEDPYNFGYSLRSAYAAGTDGIILPRRNWLSAAGIVARASAGASERFRMYMASAEEAVRFFHEKGYKVLCAEKKNSTSIYNVDLTKPVFLIVGGEKRGIAASVLKEADCIVRIDYGRDFAASLSAASAATILAYEIFRQNLKQP